MPWPRLAAIAAKWVLVGRFTAVTSTRCGAAFVWRNELADTFVEMLAAPWLIGAVARHAAANLWLRGLGARIGRGVWCESYWLPEADLVTLGDGATSTGAAWCRPTCSMIESCGWTR